MYSKTSNHWIHQQVHVEFASEYHGLFFKNGQLSSRLYNPDDIHLTNSEVKRFVDAINRLFHIVEDSTTYVFGATRTPNYPRRRGQQVSGRSARGMLDTKDEFDASV